MTMMMGDGRACAMAVNDLLTPRETAGPRISERQVEEHPRCFLFGHYDSRGGATLVRAKNLLEAFEKYAESFGWVRDEKTGRLEDPGMKQYMKSEEEYEAWKPDALHGLMEEDFMFSCNVIVCDEPFGDKSELDFGYTGPATEESDFGYEGYRYGVVQYRWKHKARWGETKEEREELSKWENVRRSCAKTLIFWKGKERPTVDPKALGMDHLDGLEVRIVKKSYGEDACGVVWQT
jgi:hypothetical protein